MKKKGHSGSSGRWAKTLSEDKRVFIFMLALIAIFLYYYLTDLTGGFGTKPSALIGQAVVKIAPTPATTDQAVAQEQYVGFTPSSQLTDTSLEALTFKLASALAKKDYNTALSIAKERKAQILSELVSSDVDVDSVLKESLQTLDNTLITPELASFVEKASSVEGVYYKMHFDRADLKGALEKNFVKTDSGEVFQVHFSKQVSPPAPNSRVRLVGALKFDNKLVVPAVVQVGKPSQTPTTLSDLAVAGAEELITPGQPESTLEIVNNLPKDGESSVVAEEKELDGRIVQLEALSEQVHKVAVILFNFRDNDKLPASAETLKKRVFGRSNTVEAYYASVSFGKWSFEGHVDASGDVFGPYTIDESSGGCRYYNWAPKAVAKAQRDGYVTTNYRITIFVIPTVSSCLPMAGWANVGGSDVWVNGFVNGNYIFVHELGHAFGLEHAKSTSCTVQKDANTVELKKNLCFERVQEYGDVHDPMGHGTSHFSSYYKTILGLEGSENVKLVDGSGTFTIKPNQFRTDGIQALVIPTNDDYFGAGIRYYWVEARKSIHGITSPLIRIGTSQWSAQSSILLDSTPSSGAWGLPAEKSFYDPSTRVRITTLSKTQDSVTVEVTSPKVCIPAAPRLEITPQTHYGAAGDKKLYSVKITNRNSPLCAAIRFDLRPLYYPAGWRVVALSMPKIASGNSRSVTVEVTSKANAPAGSYALTLFTTNFFDSSIESQVIANYEILG